MTSGSGSKRPGRARRWVGAILAAVLLPVGAALLLYSFVDPGDGSGTNAPPITTTSVMTMPAETPMASPGGTSSTTRPQPSIVVITTVIAGSGSDDDADPLTLATAITGLLASVAGIVSAIVSARAPRRQ